MIVTPELTCGSYLESDRFGLVAVSGHRSNGAETQGEHLHRLGDLVTFVLAIQRRWIDLHTLPASNSCVFSQVERERENDNLAR